MSVFHLVFAIFTLVLFAALFSEHKRGIGWKTVFLGLALQGIIAYSFKYFPPLIWLFESIAKVFVRMIGFCKVGSDFIFGPLMDIQNFGFVFVFQVLPIIVFFSALASWAFHWGVLQKIVGVLSWVLKKTMRLNGVESLSAAANVFLGQTEAPLLVKPYLRFATRSTMFCIMVGGMATIAGSVMAAYIGFLSKEGGLPSNQLAYHLLVASVLNAPAGIVFAKIMVPEKTNFETYVLPSLPRETENVLEAIAKGTKEGLLLAVNVGAMVLVFVGIMAGVNACFQWVGAWLYEKTHWSFLLNASLEQILGFLFYPVARLLSIEAADAHMVAQLLGKKLILNEFVSYVELSKLSATQQLNAHSILVTSYALCGFANFSSIGIQLGGLGTMAPEHTRTIAQLGFKAVIAGTLATLLSAVWASFLFERI